MGAQGMSINLTGECLQKKTASNDFVAVLPQPLMNVAGFAADIIHEQVLAKGVWRGEVGFAAAELGDLLHEVDEAVVAGEHESIDEDSGALALRHFLERLRDDKGIETEGILVNAPIFESKCGGLAVGDHDDLP